MVIPHMLGSPGRRKHFPAQMAFGFIIGGRKIYVEI
jgi:hypothetical protein